MSPAGRAQPDAVPITATTSARRASTSVTAARGTDGEPYAFEEIAHHLERTSSPRDLPSWLIDDLRAHVGGDLEDDATALALAWHHR